VTQKRRAAELLEEGQEVSQDEVRTLLAREAALVERLAAELKTGVLRPAELPALLENLGARLSMLADPASPWKGIGKRRG
jgi:hypothetical protein